MPLQTVGFCSLGQFLSDMSRPAKDNVTRDNKPISALSEGSVTRDRRTIRNGTVDDLPHCTLE